MTCIIVLKLKSKITGPIVLATEVAKDDVTSERSKSKDMIHVGIQLHVACGRLHIFVPMQIVFQSITL